VLALEAKFAELQADFANLEKKAACMEVELARLKAPPSTSSSESSSQENSKGLPDLNTHLLVAPLHWPKARSSASQSLLSSESTLFSRTQDFLSDWKGGYS
jgi:hypothetical protein